LGGDRAIVGKEEQRKKEASCALCRGKILGKKGGRNRASLGVVTSRGAFISKKTDGKR